MDQRADLQDRSVMEAELILFVRRVLAPKQVRALPPQLAVVEGWGVQVVFVLTNRLQVVLARCSPKVSKAVGQRQVLRAMDPMQEEM